MPKTAKSYKTNLKRYFCTDFIEIKVKKISEKKLWNYCKFRKFAKSFQTSPNVPIRWEIREKFKFAKFSNFLNLQNSPKDCQMYQFVEKYEKNPRLTNLQILEIRKIVSKVIKCANSWRNTEKSEFAKFKIFWNLQDNLTTCQMCRFVKKHNRKLRVGDSQHLRNSQQNEKL